MYIERYQQITLKTEPKQYIYCLVWYKLYKLEIDTVLRSLETTQPPPVLGKIDLLLTYEVDQDMKSLHDWSIAKHHENYH